MANRTARLKSDIKDFAQLYDLAMDPGLSELIESDSCNEAAIAKLARVWTRLDTNRSSFLPDAIANCRFQIEEKWTQCSFDHKSKTEFMLYFSRK